MKNSYTIIIYYHYEINEYTIICEGIYLFAMEITGNEI